MNIYSKNNQGENGQIEFSFMDEIREEEKKPKAELLYFENPKNDNEQMFNYQKEFYEGDELAFWKLWQLAELVAERIIRTKIKASKHRYSEDEIADKKGIAVEYVLRRLKYENGYCITTNWIVAIESGVKHALEYQTKADKLVNFVDWETMKNYEWEECNFV